MERMREYLIEALGWAASHGQLEPSLHYDFQETERPTPDDADIAFMLCADAPEVIELNPEAEPNSSCLVWGKTADGRIGHILCGYYPEYLIITAYFPAETEPYKWADDCYRIRKPYQET